MMLKDKIKDDIRLLGWVMHGVGAFLFCTLILIVVIFVFHSLDEQTTRNQRMAIEVANFMQTSGDVKSKHERLTAELKEQQDDWNEILKQLPATAQESDYLARLTRLAEKFNLQMSNFSPGASHEHETIRERDFDLMLSGTYLNLCHFMNDLYSIPRITNIHQLQIGAPNQNHTDGIYLINLKVRMAYAFQDIPSSKNFQ